MTKRAIEPSADESALIEQAKSDHDAFGQLYERYAQRIYQYIYYRTSSEADAEDLAAKTFMRAWQHMATYDDRGVPFSAWLYRIAHNLVIDHYRRRGRDSQVPIDDLPMLPSHSEDPEQAAERALTAEALRLAINRLTEEQAQVVTLRFLEGLSITEVAGSMGKTEGAIKAMQYRAVTSLRRLLEFQA